MKFVVAHKLLTHLFTTKNHTHTVVDNGKRKIVLHNLHLGKMHTRRSIDLIYADNIDEIMEVIPVSTDIMHEENEKGELRLKIRLWIKTIEFYTDDFYDKIYSHLMNRKNKNGNF